MRLDSYWSPPISLVPTGRVSNVKYKSVHIDFKTVVFTRSYPGKKDAINGLGSHVDFWGISAFFLK